MKVIFRRDTVAAGQVVLDGEVRELDEAEAKYLIAIGKAEEYQAPAKPAKKKAKKAKAKTETETAKAPPEKEDKTMTTESAGALVAGKKTKPEK